jgi:ABC-type antimicrobial peptide transport system permease subunit
MMRAATLILRSLRHYARSNVAVVLGVATAVAALAGALLVGESVRGSLRRNALDRLGATDNAIVGASPFREGLAEDLAAQARGVGARRDLQACPILALPGVVTEQASGRRAGDVLVYGVDERFWAFHGRPSSGPEDRDALVSEALAREVGGSPGATLLLRVQAPSDIPGSSLFGRRDEPGRTIRLTLKAVLPESNLGGFSLQPQQQDARVLFVPLRLLQRSLGQEGKANTVLVAGAGDAAAALRQAARLEDLGLRLRVLPGQGALALESTSALLDDAVVAAAREAADRAGMAVTGSLVYLANAIRVGDRSVPYSLLAGLDDAAFRALGGGAGSERSLLLGAWAAADLGARAGDRVTLDYYVWKDEGRLETRTTEHVVAAVVPMAGLAADRDLVPEYPGITQSEHLADWDPPFPVDLERIRPKDEEYWKLYRTTPKAFLPLSVAQELWGHRLGRLTSIRLRPNEGDLEAAQSGYAAALRAAISPESAGLRVDAVRIRALEAAQGATDFGAYFVYFSFFLVVAALLLAGLFFRLGIEQRLRELGLLRALGFSDAKVRRLFLAEGLVLAVLGGILGMVGAALYAQLMVLGLRTLWVDAVGTRSLELHVSPGMLALGALGGILATSIAIALTLRGLRARSPRSLVAGAPGEWVPPSRTGGRWVAGALAAVAAVLLGMALLGRIDATAGFFGSGSLLLAASLVQARVWLRGRRGAGTVVRSLSGLGFRGASYRPGRSVVCIALIAFAVFVIVAVGAFRHTGVPDVGARGSESGGYRLLARSLTPLHHDPATREGRTALGLSEDALEGASLARFRMRAGQDASCLNLYRPDSPTVLAPTGRFLDEGRFSFQSSLAESAEDKANPWRLLDRDAADGDGNGNGAIPVIADAGSLQYVLHKAVGDTMTLGGTNVTVRFVAALRPGLFQGELLMGERQFLQAFPEEDGYRFFLIDAPSDRAAAITEALESRLADFGFDVGDTALRLAAYHRVENTYISTFQALGSLGLLLGTAGLTTVLLRNALEQRREMALLRAVGYRERHVSTLIVAENLFLLLVGLGMGTAAALVAIAPALREREGQVPIVSVAVLLGAVILTGLAVSRVAVGAILRLPVLESLRSE